MLLSKNVERRGHKSHPHFLELNQMNSQSLNLSLHELRPLDTPPYLRLVSDSRICHKRLV
jgi:hypothetical protein